MLDRVVSSMTPTLRSLQYSRRRAVADPTGMLVVACERRPDYITGLPDLPSATREAALLRSLFPDTTTLEGEAATTTRTTEALAEHACAHFACHGGTTSTGEAALFLSDAPLTLIHLARSTSTTRILRCCPPAVPRWATPICRTRLTTSPRHCRSPGSGMSSPPSGTSVTTPRPSSPTTCTGNSPQTRARSILHVPRAPCTLLSTNYADKTPINRAGGLLSSISGSEAVCSRERQAR